MFLLLYLVPFGVYFLKRGLILPVLAASVVFTVNLYIYKQYDVPFPAYLFVCVVLIFLNKGKIITNKFHYFFFLYLVSVLVVSFFTYDPFKVLSTFILFFVFPLFYFAINRNFIAEVSIKAIIWIILAAILFDILMSVFLYSSNNGRAILNFHPIGAGLIIPIIPLFILVLNRLKKHKLYVLFFFLIISLTIISVLLSGTRGYMMVYFSVISVLGLTIYLKKRNMLLRFSAMAFIFSFCLFVIWVNYGYITASISELLRLEESLGRRSFENAYVAQLLSQSSISNQMFGYGFGARAQSIIPVNDFIFNFDTTPYMYSKTNDVTGFHNVWLTVLFSLGYFGIVMYLSFFVFLVVQVFKTKFNTIYKFALLIYVVSLALCFIYRETLFRGCLEMLILAWVINQGVNFDNEKNIKIST
ncbi:O-antigen ligase family protein [Paenibacillus thermotolerans]|uniref:O-antigen ligase family protein n=1 Tax=Paenibacillus thermotolerans TaxID=3027807 RepID=UPI002367B737|nr:MULTISPECIES: O-antigen ligase family protein [unclassified Paenibacillus]